MTGIQFRAGSEVARHRIGEVVVRDGQVSGVERCELPDHLVYLVGEQIVSEGRYAGSLVKAASWQAGEIGFKPAGLEWDCTPNKTHRASIIQLSRRCFITATRYHVDYSTIDFRFAKVDSCVASVLAGAIRMLALDPSMNAMGPLLAESSAMSLAAAIVQSLCDKAAKEMGNLSNGLSAERKRQVLDFIEAHLSQPISLEQLADVAALSTFHFSRSFKSAVGVSPMRYVLFRRIYAAKRMLVTGAPMLNVAMDCGFSSQSHFTKAFHDMVGLTPTEYRRQVTG